MPTPVRARLPLLAALAALLAAACGGGGPSRTEVVTTIATDVATPQFEQLSADTATLAGAASALCAAPSADLVEGARTAWRDTRVTWMHSAAVWFGPVMDRRSRSLIDWPEVDAGRIEEAIAARDSVTTEDVRQFFAATQRGLGAAEHLLFDGDPNEVTAALADPVRCQYLTAILAVADEEAAAVLQEWTVGSEDRTAYLDRLTGEAAISIEVGAAIDEIGATQVFLLRMLADMQLGAALAINAPAPDLAAIPGGPARNETIDLQEQLRGMYAIYLGPAGDSTEGDTTGSGLTALVADRAADADTRVRAAFDAAIAAAEAIPTPLREAAEAQTAEATAAYDALKELQLTWNTDVVSLLGITVGFSDADGDSG